MGAVAPSRRNILLRTPSMPAPPLLEPSAAPPPRQARLTRPRSSASLGAHGESAATATPRRHHTLTGDRVARSSATIRAAADVNPPQAALPQQLLGSPSKLPSQLILNSGVGDRLHARRTRSGHHSTRIDPRTTASDSEDLEHALDDLISDRKPRSRSHRRNADREVASRSGSAHSRALQTKGSSDSAADVDALVTKALQGVLSGMQGTADGSPWRGKRAKEKRRGKHRRRPEGLRVIEEEWR